MEYYYGYGDLGDKLISECEKEKPDFAHAKDLIAQMDTISISNDDGSENILSEIIMGYPGEAADGIGSGENLPAVIRLFLDSGFDLSMNSGYFGRKCLRNLAWSSYDKYTLDAAKILLDAGVDPEVDTDGESVTALMSIKMQAAGISFISDYNDENLFYTMLQIFEAAGRGAPYHGIDFFTVCIGKKISAIYVFAAREEFSKNSDGTIKLASGIVFDCEGTLLVLTDELDLYVNDAVLDNCGDTKIDFCDLFGDNIIGHTIKDIYFDQRDIMKEYAIDRQPIMLIQLTGGNTLRFTNNCGEVASSYVLSKFSILKNNT